MTDLLILVVFCIVAAIVYIWYISIVSRKNKVFEALSGIDVQQKKRSNLIPNILKIATNFMEHEKVLLTDITELRVKADTKYDKADPKQVQKHLTAVEALRENMGKFMIAVEDYPDLKSDEIMIQAQTTYNEVEEGIVAARRFYNSSVTALNNAIQIFPGNLIAPLAGARVMLFYEADNQAKAMVDADDVLK